MAAIHNAADDNERSEWAKGVSPKNYIKFTFYKHCIVWALMLFRRRPMSRNEIYGVSCCRVLVPKIVSLNFMSHDLSRGPQSCDTAIGRNAVQVKVANGLMLRIYFLIRLPTRTTRLRFRRVTAVGVTDSDTEPVFSDRLRRIQMTICFPRQTPKS